MRRIQAALLSLLVTAGPAAAGDPLALETLEGEPVTLALRSDEAALLVHFWATWCPECEDELPILADARARCAKAGVRIVTVSVGESREKLLAYLVEKGLTLRPLRDPRGRTWRGLGGRGLPTNLIWTGADRRIEVGPLDADGWRAALHELGCGASAAPSGQDGAERG